MKTKRKKKRVVDTRQDEIFVAKLRQLSSGLMHLVCTLDYQRRACTTDIVRDDGLGFSTTGADQISEELAELVETVRNVTVHIHENLVPINPDAIQRIKDMDVPQ
jgi:hypothetical protein